MVSLLPIAFGFGNLAMLGWLAAAAAPILIHLWMRHTHRDLPWAAIEFLREAIKRNARRLKLQQWILLAVRTLLLVLLVLAAAKPYLSGWNLLGGGPKVHRVLVLDASFSMAYQEGEETIFATSQQHVEELLESSRPGEVFSVCLMADPPRAVVTGPIADARRVAHQVAACQPTSGAAELRDTLELVEELISEANEKDRDYARHEVLFFTDLGKSSWRTALEDAEGDDGSVAPLLTTLSEQASLLVVDVGATDASNLAVSDLQLADTLATSAAPLRLECKVVNHSDQPAANVVAQLTADGTTFDEQTVTLPARGSATLTFDAAFSEAAWHSLSVRLPGDALAVDDEVHLAAEVQSRVKILLVEGAPRAARYLVHALNPSGTPSSPLEPVVVAEGALAETPLDDFACVFLCNIAQFTSQEAELLERYTSRGGSLVFFLGDRVQSEAYNDVLGVPSSTSGATAGQASSGTRPMRFASATIAAGADVSPALLPATIGPLTPSTEFGLDPLDYRHPITAAFRGRERAGLLTTPVSFYFQLQATTGRGAEVAIALPGGDPFLVTNSYGRGAVTVVATSASLDTLDAASAQPWTLMPAWPSFLPIVRELVSFATAHGQEQASAQVGDVISQSLPANWSAATIDVERPEGRRDSLPVERTGDQSRWSYASTDELGIYQVLPESGNEPLAMIAVNVDPRESDLTRIDPALLPDTVTLRRGEPASASGLTGNTAIHRWLLYAVLALLLIESTLAWAFGGRSA